MRYAESSRRNRSPASCSGLETLGLGHFQRLQPQCQQRCWGCPHSQGPWEGGCQAIWRQPRSSCEAHLCEACWLLPCWGHGRPGLQPLLHPAPSSPSASPTPALFHFFPASPYLTSLLSSLFFYVSLVLSSSPDFICDAVEKLHFFNIYIYMQKERERENSSHLPVHSLNASSKP